VVEPAGEVFGCGPAFPTVGFIENEGVFLPFELGLHGFVLLEAIEIFEEQEPSGLLGVVQLGGAAGLLAEHVIDVFEGLFKMGFVRLRLMCARPDRQRTDQR
jgi:hypothetical protein